MTEATEAPRDKAKDTIAMTAATMGRDLVAALLEEVRGMPDHWAKIDSTRQQKIIENLKDKTRRAIDQALTLMMRSEFQAVPAKLEFVNRKEGIRAGLTVKGDAVCRHALFDASGTQVLVIIADPKQWTARMDEIMAKDDQPDLFDTSVNYDPARDQPGYRRDQDRLAPAGKTWAELKESFGVAGENKQPDYQTRYDAAFAEIYGKKPLELTEDERASDAVLRAHNAAVEKLGGPKVSDLPEDRERVITQRILQEKLVGLLYMVSLGAIQAWTPEEFAEVERWADEIAKDGTSSTLPPSCLPQRTDEPPENPEA